jgi:hypothetical protein
MRRILIVIMLLVTSAAMADLVYYVKVDAEGYVVDLTAFTTSLPDYERIVLTKPVKTEYLTGHYKLNRETGEFIKDELKMQELAAQPDTEGM